ncbi:Glycosyltransferase involved in cell wall bisynthesis [Petrocella atlantisensis]|uniref:Glycosyltransferase involved in cell wall bisynthesis n=1 Tax=Petrocella atlantisensis TaxID=2173034 RepID=A0A3P7PB78_9FIRM|nr:glycosyltransferase [Petrocella atlantisensis]VDN46168.1 Glycosyltransferase involved in cell wall bisynthesis [Petrocella atlantisensis]
MKHIAIIIPQIGTGGAEKVATILSNAFHNAGHKVYVIVNDDKIQDYAYSGELISLKSGASTNPLIKGMNLIQRLVKTRKLKKVLAIDTSISMLNGSNILNLLSRGRGRTIVSVRNNMEKNNRGLMGALNNMAMRHLYKKADKIVAVSQVICNDLVKKYGFDQKHQIMAIYNPYELAVIEKLSSDPMMDEELAIFTHPTVITAGRLDSQKGHWHLIRAFAEVKKVIKDAKLIILGKGELSGYLSQLAKDLQIETDVHFLGFQKNPYKYFEKASVFVLPSLYEGFPNALCEAMICGLPVIASDCISGPREILAPDTPLDTICTDTTYETYGILTPECDGVMYMASDALTKEERCLSSTMIKIIEDQTLRESYAKKAKSRAIGFGVDKIMKLWEEIL